MSNQEAAERRRTSLEKKLAAYSAAAGASLLAVAAADAQTLYTDTPDTLLVPGVPVYLNLNQDGPADLSFHPFADLSLTLMLPPAEAGKTDIVSYGDLVVAAMSNAYVYFLRIAGSIPYCGFGVQLGQSSCSAVPVANCYLNPPSGRAGKGEGVISPTAGYVPLFPAVGDQFIRVGGVITALPTAAGKSQALPSFEGWVRFQVGPGSTSAGDTGPGPQVIIKDHAIVIEPGAPISCDATSLPVEFVSFDAKFDGDELSLVWETASEINNAGFEVQYRAGDQNAFSALGFVPGSGTTADPQVYTHTVAGLQPGPYVFRLKQIDLDGAFKYTDELEVMVEVPGSHFLSDAYPNPFNPQANFSLVVPVEQKVRVELFDAVGRSVAVLYDGVAQADTPVRMNIRGENLPSGTYLYRATGETFVESKQVVLAK